MDNIKTAATGTFVVAIYVAAFVLWIYALGHSAVNGNSFMFDVDFALPPVGIIHGILILLGVV